MNKTITAEQMINYLQERFAFYKKDVKEHGDDVYNVHYLQEIIACKEMVEYLIREPVNLQKDGKVTIGF